VQDRHRAAKALQFFPQRIADRVKQCRAVSVNRAIRCVIDRAGGAVGVNRQRVCATVLDDDGFAHLGRRQLDARPRGSRCDVVVHKRDGGGIACRRTRSRNRCIAIATNGHRGQAINA